MLSAICITGFGDESGVVTTVGTYIETETNNAVWAAGNLTVAPGLIFGLKGKETPLYGRIEFENRQQAKFAVSGYTGQELRTKFKIGGDVKFGKISFNPEYELRFKAYVGQPLSELSIYENRFHLNFTFPVGEKWSVYLKAMPTLIVNINDSRDESGDENVFQDYYQEIELGTAWAWNQNNTLLLGIYNELGFNEKVENPSGVINGGKNFEMYEFQFRIIYRHKFGNGINLDPFARIGIVRNLLYQTSPDDISTENFRRDRFGVNVKYSAENGITPYMQTYYQRSNMGDDPVQHRFELKVGLDYVF